MKLIDNIQHRLGDDLKANIRKGSKLSISAASFSIYAFEALKKELGKVEELRFIFSTPTFVAEQFQKVSRKFYIPHIVQESELCGGEFELRLMNQLNQRAIAKECSKWVQEKVTFKTNTLSNQQLNGMVHIQNEGEAFAYANVNSFTTADLGITHKKGFPTLIQRSDFPNSLAYLDWFNQVWENEADLKDVTQQVQDYFASAYKENSPEFIYFITLYNIFNDFLDDLSLDNLPDDQIGFKQTVIWEKLYNFQKDAVIGAINKLEKYKGCILADSVGLGKTFSALGVIKYYEMRNKDVLVLCPKKLEANWNTYRQNDTNNILIKDRLRYDVLFHTDLSRTRGMSNGRNLESVNWGNYGLIVIDESHNFRNNNTVVGKENRYQKLLRKIIKEGIETKVLMLSATPVNNRFNDLRNQLALAYEGNPENIDHKLDTSRGIDSLFKSAQKAFNVWSNYKIEERTTEKLLDMLDFDFFEMLDALTIARSRKHITTYYDTSAIGKFPQRNKPVSIHSALTVQSKKVTYVDIAETLVLLNLSVYTPINYILPSKIQIYADLYDKTVGVGASKLKQFDREASLRILMRINLLKRLESSIDSFRLTLENILVQIKVALAAIEKGEGADYEGIESKMDEENFDWEANWGDEENVIGKKIKVHISDMDTTRWKEDLKDDLFVIEELLSRVVPIVPALDTKLQHLLAKLEDKIENPINPNNKKAIIFTAFADTANYLYKNIKDHFKKKYNINSALITGSSKQSTSKKIPAELNKILTCFSPRSKDKEQLYPSITDSIDILVATDCISEGQNLQDCDFLVNYDIHWNPVRIIQRFGRIDRIGSINTHITLVNFWPDVTLDNYINLKSRVENKMLITNMASTGDDNILNTDATDLDYRKVQLQRLQEEVIDLEDLGEGVSITDLGLNDFRVDLSTLLEEYGELKHIPEGLHAVVKSSPLL